MDATVAILLKHGGIPFHKRWKQPVLTSHAVGLCELQWFILVLPGKPVYFQGAKRIYE